MDCWICGKAAETGEHLMKVSDLRGLFGHVSQNKLLYVHSSKARNVPKRTVMDPAFKSKALLCADCNNNLSQPYDKAWEQLSGDLRSRPSIRPGDSIEMAEVFKQPVEDALLDTHLYFVKLFGCLIAEHKVPIDLRPFASAFLTRTAHPHVFIAIGPTPSHEPGTRVAGWTEVNGNDVDGRCTFAYWSYHVGIVAVRILYAEPGMRHKELVQAWHPDTAGRLMLMASFDKI
ncbi:hypothetical protein [Cupriavidus basilensis]|uniref:hypothetical protein n=1 Tax=Cupriavidus basilensis TaxID=68895 RepID=UPI0005BDF792|nr:hypothetical protein [Cupriavidus basilensis]